MNLSKQEFLNCADSAKYIQDKRKLREQLEKDVAEFLAKGGVIQEAVSQTYKANHGTADQYKKRGCRCELCVAWALEKGRVKTTKLQERKL